MSSDNTKNMNENSTSEEEVNVKNEEVQEKEISEEQKAEEQQIDEKEDEKNSEEARITELEEEIKNTKDALLRKAAELENVRKRVQRERIQLFEEAKAGALEDFMPISDDLNRTLKAAEESDVEEGFLKGITLVANKFQEVLEKHGVERINETGVPFDVNIHDAMMKQPATDESTGSDTVLEVLESGYKIGNRTIRHAKVIVSE
ncbi:MAG: nucleotide exchange factor GrpE [Balneolaceae bacterium]